LLADQITSKVIVATSAERHQVRRIEPLSVAALSAVFFVVHRLGRPAALLSVRVDSLAIRILPPQRGAEVPPSWRVEELSVFVSCASVPIPRAPDIVVLRLALRTIWTLANESSVAAVAGFSGFVRH
jgi:hypothetical protein